MFEQISMFDLLNPESRFTSECRKGSGFENGKIRIYCASLNMGLKELAEYLKEEYGTGGHSASFPDGGKGFTDYNGSGLKISEWKTNQTEKHSWLEVAREIKRLIGRNDYLTEKEWERLKEVSQLNGGPAPIPVPRMSIEAVIKWRKEQSASSCV